MDGSGSHQPAIEVNWLDTGKTEEIIWFYWKDLVSSFTVFRHSNLNHTAINIWKKKFAEKQGRKPVLQWNEYYIPSLLHAG